MRTMFRCFVLLVSLLHICASKKCFYCQNSPLPRVCNTLIECAAHETCYTEAVVASGGHIFYNSGCVTRQHCPNFHNSAYQIVGKRDLTHLTKRADISACVECCGDDFCNIQGCGTKRLPQNLAGPLCYSCDKTLNPSACNTVQVCAKDYLCSIQEHPSFMGLADTVYQTKCMPKTTCDQLNTTSTNGKCPPVCCNTDFCNSHCGSGQVVTSPRTTQMTTARPYSQLIEQTCRGLLFQGYFYDSYTNLCVNLVKKPMTQAQAARACAADGASLMIVDESTKQDFLIYWIFSHRVNDTDYWIGARSDTNGGHTYHWVDGSTLSYLTYNNWGNNLMGQPDDRRVKNENCVYLNYIDNYFWHDDKCSENKTGYICEIGPLPPQQEGTAIDDITSGFPSLLEAECRRHVFDGYYYDHNTNLCIALRDHQHITQADAAAACARDNAHLVTIDDKKKTNFLLTWIFSNRDNQTDFWIGATDKYDNSTFYWPTGDIMSYTHWGSPIFPPVLHGQPDTPRVKNENCVYMDYIHNYFWYDDDCQNRRKGYICEIPDHGHLETECRKHFAQGYYYDHYANMCIKLHKDVHGVTHAAAAIHCLREHARLATIDSERKTNFMLSWIFSHSMNDTDFWIGAHARLNTSTFYWPSGAQLNYTHWYTITPPPPENCVILDHVNNYKWLTAQCEKPRSGYICEVNKHTVAFIVSAQKNRLTTYVLVEKEENYFPDTQYCNKTGGYINIPGDSSSGLCIKYHQQSKTLTQAAQICKAENARLVSLDTFEKYTNLKSYLKEIAHGSSSSSKIWMGLLHVNNTHHDFIWNSGKPLTYSSWISQPSSASQCFYMDPSQHFNWADMSCTRTAYFVCRK